MATRVILDTDIGTDVDDCVALALTLRSPELRLEGVTCVYGDVLLRARMVLKLLRLSGCGHVPVMTGARRPLLGRVPVYWAGHEGRGLLEPEDDALLPDSEPAPDFIARKVMESPGEIHLIAIGPLTNVAMAILREPLVAESLAHLTIMGGVVRGPERLDLPYAEHNIRCDPEAAHIVLSSGAPTTLVPLDVTTQVRIRPEDVERIRQGGDELDLAVARQIELYPPFGARGFTYLHDPLAAATVVRPDLVELVEARVDVELAGTHSTAATLARTPLPEEPSRTRIAVSVNIAEAERFIVDRLASRARRM